MKRTGVKAEGCTQRGLRRALGTVLAAAWLSAATMTATTATGWSQAPAAARVGDGVVQTEAGTVVAVAQRTLEVQTLDPVTQQMVRHRFVLAVEAQANGVHVGDAVEVSFVVTAVDRTVRSLTVKPGGKLVSPAKPISSVNLGTQSQSKTATIKAVPLGGKDSLAAPVLKGIEHEIPKEECNRSNADWPTQPVGVAVLDFRYPVDREEAHDVGSTGGGSGTAVADLVYARLDELGEYALRRGDRSRLYRADFAGAARVGRLLGVDAVLAGTFAPVDASGAPDTSLTPKSYELRAGMVDTCTGQLLMTLSSVMCQGAAGPGMPADRGACTHHAVSAKDATDPVAHAQAYKEMIDALLFPIEHGGTPAGQVGSGGTVTAVDKDAVTVKLAAGSKLKVGDQVAVHAWRLAKNASTYTLQRLQDMEIGRVAITAVQGGMATGKFTGDFVVKVGDTAELIPEQ